ncbi:cytokine-like nuclear factor N-PAC [Anomaloglossus baeobatrachus]|uniref:cytokine-like nuclear factor N-PAC n=1 Tax=Anomaloglossus baeobatrachus TaxID=238106 RepID=UPI003F502251
MAATVSLRQGDLVWGKLGRYPPWPGKIVNPPKDLKKPRGKKCLFVKFFGTEDHAWIKVEQLQPYHLHKEEMIKSNKGKRFQQSVDAVEEFLKKVKAKQEQNASDEKGKKGEGKGKKGEGKGKKGEGKGKKAAGEKKKKKSSDAGSSSTTKKSHEQSPRKRGRPPKEDKDSRSPQPSSLKKLAMKTVSRFSWPPPTSEVRLKLASEDYHAADVSGLDWRRMIGFLGLGLMGSGIVSNLLKMGHTVTVWNRTAEKNTPGGIHSEVWDPDEDSKCDLFIQEGAHLGRTPAEVVSTCDITFACVADPKAAKDLVLGPSGVLQGIRPGKCYVDMSTVDPETAAEVAQIIVSRGGRFLEAPVAGNQQLSNDGMLMILAAGDQSVFEDCSSCFQAMGRTSFFLGEAGNAARMMLIINMVQGSFMATIAEGMTLAQVTGQSQQTLLDILIQSQLSSIFLDQKCQNILQGNFKPDFYLKYIQKDLRLAIAMGDSVNHPTPMAAAANEVYKRAKALDQSDNDMSAVYRAYIH